MRHYAKEKRISVGSKSLGGYDGKKDVLCFQDYYEAKGKTQSGSLERSKEYDIPLILRRFIFVFIGLMSFSMNDL
ncbi:MAG: hypothetical protein ACLUIS_06440 [Longibaculum sp.]